MASASTFEPSDGRHRVGWWLFVGLLGVVAAYIAHSFVGLLVVGVFGYYATRPICRRLGRVVDSDSLAAGATVTLVLLPVTIVTLYAGFQVVEQVAGALDGASNLPAFVRSNFALDALPKGQRRTLVSTLQNPRQHVTSSQGVARSLLEAGIATLSTVFSTLLFVVLSITLSFTLLKHDDDLSAALRHLFGGRDTTAHAYAAAVDADLESVFYGNLLFVVAMSVIAGAAYWATNLLAPQGVHVPMVFALAFLTGVASLVPVVVGKLVYLPVVGLLAVQVLGTGSGGDHLVFLAATLVAYFLLLDVLPQTFLQPYLSGRHLDMLLLLFGYVLGPVLFGWYGFFLLPIVFVVMLEAVRVVLPELLHGEQLTPTVSLGESVGASLPTSDGDAGTGSDGATGPPPAATDGSGDSD